MRIYATPQEKVIAFYTLTEAFICENMVKQEKISGRGFSYAQATFNYLFALVTLYFALEYFIGFYNQLLLKTNVIFYLSSSGKNALFFF
ncbi:MAG: hypothetical protein ACXWDO_12995 [Bacteroidia bacterium]